MTKVTQVYPLKLPQTSQLRERIDCLRNLCLLASQKLLRTLWSEEWLEKLAKSKKKAYKVVDEAQVRLVLDDQAIYLPSRIRRGIAEIVGRILRSQADRRNCYADVLRVVQHTGVEGNLNELVRTVAVTLVKFYGKYYRWALIRQFLRTFRRYYYKLGMDLTFFQTMPYPTLIKPRIRNFAFPYAPDDGQAIKITRKHTIVEVEMKLPHCEIPKTRQDWGWSAFSLEIPPKIYHRVQREKNKLHLPTLRYITLKGGLQLPFLEFAWSHDQTDQKIVYPQRELAADLGLINLTTSVVCEAGSQISRPIFWSPSSILLQKIEQIYEHIAHLQRKLDKHPPTWIGQGRRAAELERLYRKLNRFREELLHLVSNQLIATALVWHCRIIVLEDLRSYEPPKHQRTLSRKLSNWLRGALYTLLDYKTKRCGLKLIRVNPWGTSSYCPRCGQKGTRIVEPRSKKVQSEGRFFSCPSCEFTADRDYIAAINIYRMHQAHRKKQYHLKRAKPVPYMATGIPLNRLSGTTAQVPLSG
ncbi:MAG: RNA-guided endonuclease InsQ/TnpB family protein [Candidatus Thorarchaeota archaeon]